MVSVIIPVYNAEKYLPACIESVCGQTLFDLEIILVDDGSTDRSGAICDEFAQKDNRVVVIHKKNGGHTSARNTGLKAARGEYIGFVDSDDWIEPTMYEDMLSASKHENADVVVSAYYFEAKGKTCSTMHPVPGGIYQEEDWSMDKLLRNLIYSEDYSGGGISSNLWSKLFQRDLLCRCQFEVDSKIIYGEDAACVYPCLIDANRIAVIEQAYYHYCIRENSICNTADERYFERITYLYRQLKRAFSNHPGEEILMEQLNRYMLDLVLQGVNKMFGFSFGKIVPMTILPYDLPQKRHLETIVLYGAGEIGQRYYKWYEKTKMVTVAAWVDRDWKKYQAEGLPVRSFSVFEGLEYDGVLIAVSNVKLAEKIMGDLKLHGIPEKKIFYEEPQSLIQTLPKPEGEKFLGGKRNAKGIGGCASL